MKLTKISSNDVAVLTLRLAIIKANKDKIEI
jgi:hypothetical protein